MGLKPWYASMREDSKQRQLAHCVWPPKDCMSTTIASIAFSRTGNDSFESLDAPAPSVVDGFTSWQFQYPIRTYQDVKMLGGASQNMSMIRVKCNGK
jgi:hypothetical protein